MTNIFSTRFPLVLASSSSIRQKLLRDANVPASFLSVPLDEEQLRRDALTAHTNAHDLSLLLANAKAQKSFEFLHNDETIVIAADQILECHGKIFSKPTSLDMARSHLKKLRGHTHTLHTALTLWQNGHCLWEHVSSPILKMRNFSDDFLEKYLNYEHDELCHCVGAYRLEGPGVHLFQQIEGDMDAILGLPRLPLLKALRHHAGLLT